MLSENLLPTCRMPSLGHRCLAFLARLCSIKLFLSIRLDDLLEQALWAEGVPHQEYVLGGRRMPARCQPAEGTDAARSA